MTTLPELFWFVGGIAAGVFVAAVVGIAWKWSFGGDE